ncbi:hypothetical protein TNCV_2553031 [Trichonephila clavipes]|nr:hypothetical protein TNCV_2553031 [Trichonephila clavipes]
MIVQFRNEKVSNDGSIPITIDCNVVAFIVFEEGFHQPIKRTKHHDDTRTESHNGPRSAHRATIDEACLTENTVTWVDGEKMDLGIKGGGMDN